MPVLQQVRRAGVGCAHLVDAPLHATVTARDDPPDAVVFGDPAGDPVEGSDEFHDCSEGGDYDDIFELLARVVASEGFVSGTP
jgi:hypothetical protein